MSDNDAADDDALGENVVFFPGASDQRFTPDLLLRGALKADLEDVVILGWDEDGDLFFSGSLTSKGDILWLLENARMALLLQSQDDD